MPSEIMTWLGPCNNKQTGRCTLVGSHQIYFCIIVLLITGCFFSAWSCIKAICLDWILVCRLHALHSTYPYSTFDWLLCHHLSLPYTTVKMIDAINTRVLFHPTAIMFCITQHLYDLGLSNIYHLSHTCRTQAAMTSGVYGKTRVSWT